MCSIISLEEARSSTRCNIRLARVSGTARLSRLRDWPSLQVCQHTSISSLPTVISYHIQAKQDGYHGPNWSAMSEMIKLSIKIGIGTLWHFGSLLCVIILSITVTKILPGTAASIAQHCLSETASVSSELVFTWHTARKKAHPISPKKLQTLYNHCQILIILSHSIKTRPQTSAKINFTNREKPE